MTRARIINISSFLDCFCRIKAACSDGFGTLPDASRTGKRRFIFCTLFLHRTYCILHRNRMFLHRTYCILHRNMMFLHRNMMFLHRNMMFLHRDTAFFAQEPAPDDTAAHHMPRGAAAPFVLTVIYLYQIIEIVRHILTAMPIKHVRGMQNGYRVAHEKKSVPQRLSGTV